MNGEESMSQSLCEAIIIKEEERLRSQANLFRKNVNWASDIGVCAREMFYSITDWDKKPIPEPYLLARFEEGREQEKKVIKKLMENGFEIVEGQKPFEIKDRNGRVILTGRIDGKIRWDNRKIPFEVKSLMPSVYSQIDTVEDFNKYSWAKKYPLQMMSYLFGENIDEGIFILTDCLGHFKVIPVRLDYASMESILQRCELVMNAVDKKTPPDFFKDTSVCRKCWALGRVCSPPLDFGEGVAIIDDAEIEVKLAKRDELYGLSKEFEVLDKEVKGYFRNKPHCLCGNFEIIGKEQIRKIPAQPEKETKSWITKIENISNVAPESKT